MAAATAQNPAASTASGVSTVNTASNSSATSATSATSAFGSSTFSFSFGSPNASTTPAKPAEPEVPKLTESKQFGFVFKGKSPAKEPQTSTGNAAGVEDVSDDENVEEEENNTYFAPVIPLPDKVDVKTGEEDENVLYSHRAKLFRFRSSEWRERGLGDVKILQHKQTGQLR